MNVAHQYTTGKDQRSIKVRRISLNNDRFPIKFLMMDGTIPSSPETWPPRRVALATLTVVAIILAFWILFEFRLVFFSLFTAIVLSTAIKPMVDQLSRRKLSRPAAVIFISLLLVIALVVLIITVAPLIIEQWATMTWFLGNWYQELRRGLVASDSLLVQRIAMQLPAYLPLTIPTPDLESVDNDSLDLIERAFNVGTAILRSILIVLGVALLTNFWILEGDRATRMFLLAIPPTRREGVREFLSEVEAKVGAYTRGLVILSLIIGGMSLVSYIIIGLPNVLLLAIIAGIAEAIPLVGPLIGAIPALAVALSTDPSKVIWVLLATAIFQTLENNFIVPRVMDRAVGVNPVASLLAFIAFGSIFGFVGALLAIPLAAVIQIVLTRFLFQANPAEQAPPTGRDMISTLRYEAQDLALDVRKQVRDKETELNEHTDQIEDAMEAIVQDLDSILAQFETPEPAGMIESGPRGNEKGNGKGLP